MLQWLLALFGASALWNSLSRFFGPWGSWTELDYIVYGVAFNDTWVPLYMLYNRLNSLSTAYGRYAGFKDPKAGIHPRLYWTLMEIPNLVGAAVVLSRSMRENKDETAWVEPGLLVALCFVFHYVLRVFVFGLCLRGGSRNPLSTLLLSTMFTLINGYAQVRYHTHYATYPDNYIASPTFVAGVAIFFAGLVSNHWCDSLLRNLRKSADDKKHYIPQGFLFEYVSGANFFCETVEWLGYAIASGTFLGWSFFWSTLVNTGVRAMDHHDDYRKKFKEQYPKDRKAFVPFVL